MNWFFCGNFQILDAKFKYFQFYIHYFFINSFRLPVCPPVLLSVHLSVRQYIFPSVCLSVCLSAWLLVPPLLGRFCQPCPFCSPLAPPHFLLSVRRLQCMYVCKRTDRQTWRQTKGSQWGSFSYEICPKKILEENFHDITGTLIPNPSQNLET